jgi:hypothetical protein
MGDPGPGFAGAFPSWFLKPVGRWVTVRDADYYCFRSVIANR